tara:strand:+ start:153 stop:1703 length:1551 start_codon:yes stop_codon:yes gene_type:complete
MTAFRLLLPFLLVGSLFGGPNEDSQTANGSVFHDFNDNGVRDAGEPGIGGVLVSNQIEVVKTDSDGNWQLPVREDCIFFVNKPSGWMTPVDSRMLPRFYYNHKPNGSPKTKYAGVKPTGPLPQSIDFPLTKQTEPGLFKAVFLADPQCRDQKELDYLAHDVVEELIGTEGRFGVTLGDILFDDLSLYDNHNALVALIGVPWYNVIGNHDLNFDAPNDTLSDETFERVFGPAYYAYSYGPVNFIVLDNVNWRGRENGYDGNLGADQLTFLKNLIPQLPEDEMLVLLMHIPLGLTKDREELFRLIEHRPYTLSLAGHTHWQAHQFLDANDGWRGTSRHQHVIAVTASGSWWGGEPDENGIPHTMMRDGAPNGYLLVTFNGQQAIVDFKAARRPADYQIRVVSPERVSAADAPKHEVFANVFNGSEKSTVRFRVGAEGTWLEMTKTVEPSPAFLRLKANEEIVGPDNLQGRPLGGVVKSAHLWKAALPSDLKPGLHRIFVQSNDMYGRVLHANRSIRIE